jgi:hypothetical protein
LDGLASPDRDACLGLAGAGGRIFDLSCVRAISLNAVVQQPAPTSTYKVIFIINTRYPAPLWLD